MAGSIGGALHPSCLCSDEGCEGAAPEGAMKPYPVLKALDLQRPGTLATASAQTRTGMQCVYPEHQRHLAIPGPSESISACSREWNVHCTEGTFHVSRAKGLPCPREVMAQCL